MIKLKHAMKWLFGVTLFLILVFFGLSLVGHLTDEKPIQGLELTELPTVTDEQNAYLPLSFIDSADYDIGDLSASAGELIYQRWNAEIAHGLLSSHERALTGIDEALKRQIFVTSIPEWTSPFPNYSVLVAFSKLKIVESRLAAERGDFALAMQSWSDGLSFAQLVKKDGASTLIAYMVGLVMLEEQLAWAHTLMTSYELTAGQFNEIEQRLASIRDPLNRDIEEVFTGEFIFSEMMLHGMHQASLSAGLDILRSSDLRMFIPSYFYQKQALNNLALRRFHGLQRQAASLCLESMDWDFENPNKLSVEAPYWFEPNSLGREYLESDDLSETFGVYVQRHCLARFHVEALRVVARIKRQRTSDGTKSSEAVTSFFSVDELPVDPFSNGSLTLDLKSGRITSVGTDFRLAFRTSGTRYFGRCWSDDSCSDNPMLEIDNPLRVNPSEQYDTPAGDDECQDEDNVK